jgi:uncharacterized protein YndB with AHSA1/START domain
MSDKNGSASAGRVKVVLERTYRARVEDLWELWTTKEGFESWWGPAGFRAEVHTLEARTGGSLNYDMIADSPEMIAAMKQMGRPASHNARVRFAEFKPLERLVIATVIDFVPGVKPYESSIAVDFFPSGATVRMVVTMDPMHDEEFTRMSKMGFTSQLSKLDRRFAVPEDASSQGRAL